MARYIDADKLINSLELSIKSWGRDCNSNAPIMMRAYQDAIYRVKHLTTADVVPRSEEGAECPTCHGTGRIGTTDWLTKGLSKKQLAEEKAKAIAEHEQHIKQDVAREIFKEFERLMENNEVWFRQTDEMRDDIAELKKKYIERSDTK